MSHGGGGDDNVDPDLTPLLDLVMQLLMFFIINVNFVAEQVSPEIRLASSESARPVDKADPAALFLNQKVKSDQFARNRLTQKERERLESSSSVVLIPGQPPMSLAEAKVWLKDKYDDLRKKDIEQGGDREVKTIIHFRPDGDLEYAELLKLMNHCKTAGFKKLKVRAIVVNKGSA